MAGWLLFQQPRRRSNGIAIGVGGSAIGMAIGRDIAG
jgi:hypothetical protein